MVDGRAYAIGDACSGTHRVAGIGWLLPWIGKSDLSGTLQVPVCHLARVRQHTRMGQDLVA
jgi:hypothetical protein